jgi:hypothetical protein
MSDTVRIEDLEIVVKTTSDKAVTAFEDLEGALSDFQGSASNVKIKSLIKQIKELQASIDKITAGATQRIKELADGVSQLSSVKQLNVNKNTANTIQSIASATNSIPADVFSKINGLSTGLTALSNIGKATGLNSFMRSLKQLPEVVSAVNVIPPDFNSRMQGLQSALKVENMGDASKMAALVNSLAKLPTITQALNDSNMDKFAEQIKRVAEAMRPLADEASKVYVSLRWLPGIVNQVVAANGKLPSTLGNVSRLSSKYTGLGQALRLVKRGLDVALQSASEWFDKTNEHVEALNLFRVTMQDSADSAMEFAQTVQDIVGIDMTEWMQAQGSIAQVFRGFGVASRDIQLLSQNLTQLGYDIASVFNQDTELVLSRLQSAISGQVKGMREYGVDVSVAAIKQTALELGINKNVSAMSQAEKAMLRYATIMRNTTNIQGDLARTIVTPANALRILKSQLEIMQRTLGQVVSVIATAAIPVFQVLTQAITFAADAIAKFFGYDLQEIDYSGISNVTLGAEEAEDAFTGAAGAAKKLKDYIMGFDELNVINPTQGGGGSGGIGAGSGMDFDLPDYSYDFLGGLEEKTSEWKKKIDEIATAFLQLGTVVGTTYLVIKNWDGVKDALYGIGGTIYSVFGKEFEDGVTESAREALERSVAKIGILVKNILKGLTFSAMIAIQGALQFKTVADIAAGRADLKDKIFAALNTILLPLGGAAMFGTTGFVIGLSVSILATIAGITFGKYQKGLDDYYASEQYAEIENVKAVAGETVEVTKEMYINFETQTDITEFRNTMSEAQSEVERLFTILKKDGKYTVSELKDIEDIIKSINKKNLKGIKLEYDNLTGSINMSEEAVKEQLTTITNNKEAENSVTKLKIAHENFQYAIEQIPGALDECRRAEEKAGDAQERYNTLLDRYNEIVLNGGSITEGFASEIGVAEQHLKDAKDASQESADALSALYELMKDSEVVLARQKDGFGKIQETAKTARNSIKEFTDSLKNIPSQIKSKIKVDIDISTTHANATIKGITIHGGGGGTFAQGGFPERGDLFIANEQGAEMIGSFGGKPAVANNTQIIEGVASGVAKANQEELVLLREQNELLRKMLAKPTSVKIGEREFGEAVVNSVNQRTIEFGDNGIRW